tara:strand:+ start:230870 stop:231655 length:786 start_codon:yes stop_codon:yes gene_type:complete
MEKTKKILVTGANGQLGLSLKDVSLNYPNIQFHFKNSTELDITNEKQIEELFAISNFDYCINCAAYTNVEEAEKTPEIAFKVNAEGVKNIAKACKEFEVLLIHISTDYVFDGEKKEPYTVADAPNPINEYGKSKLAGEKYIEEISNYYYIVRTSWLYSKIHGRNFYKTILEKAKKGEVIKITDEQVGCPTDTKNLANFILEQLITRKEKFGIIHFSDQVAMTWYDFACQILKVNGVNNNELLVKDRNYRTFARRPNNSVLR